MMLDPQIVNAIMSSPVLIAAVGVISAFLARSSGTPSSDKKEAEDLEKKKSESKIDEIHEISKTLDRHINNSDTPFRQQINDKLDVITKTSETNSKTIAAVMESVKSINMNVDSLARRIDSLEDDVEDLESGSREEKDEK